MVAEGLRQLQERGVELGIEHLTLESAFLALEIPRSSSHAAWSIDDDYTPQETYQRAVLKKWLLERESSIFADSAREALMALYADPASPPSEGSIMRTAIQAAFAAGMGLTGAIERGDGDFLSTDLALRFALISQSPPERDSEIEDWVSSGERTNRHARIEDSFRPLAQVMGYRPRPEFGERAFLIFAIVSAALVEGIGLRHRIMPEWELDQPLLETEEGEAPKELIGICIEALVPVFFEKIPKDERGAS